jgi:chromosome segregation protein
LQAHERATREAREKLAALTEGRERTAAALEEVRKRLASDEAALQNLPVLAETEKALQDLTASVGQARSAVTEAHTKASGLERERQMREQRRTELQREHERWTQRTRAAQDQIAAITERLGQARIEHGQLQDLPQAFAERRQTLLNELSSAETARKAAADRLAEADAALRQSRQTLAEAREQVAAAREAKARIEARLDAARSRRTEHAQMISDAMGCAPEACLTTAGIDNDTGLPPLADVERQLQRLRSDRERLGGVNLAADDELAAMSEQFNTLDSERAELEEAINKLRGGIGQLNREGRKRLLEAFESVNTHFQSLFSTLFNGGEARLELIEAEDPLESGLEIIARPPGKKPNVLSLLSGGEQTLTALSLIFAVFLTNPSPICVLDEVDAPLDDANVDRFCTMMERMAADTATRFLVITHHPMTMARMNRLFGVTMGERGVSQLVSVDLSTAERIVDQATDAA